MNGMTLTIKGLFGHFNYEIPLYGLESVDGIPMSDGVTILTGPNGYGKSTILHALEAVSKGDLEFFFNLKFEELILGEDGSAPLRLSQSNQGVSVDDESLAPEFIEILRTVNDNSIFVDGKKYEVILQTSQKTNVLHEALLKARKELPRQMSVNVDNQLQRWSERLKRTLPDTFMIREQRLLKIENRTSLFDGWAPPKISQTVTELSEKLKNQFTNVFDEYSEKDNQLNASFPFRILNQSGGGELTKEEFDRLYQDMNDKLRVLRENGLSDVAQQDIPAFQAEKVGVLRIFFDDFNAKYQVYEPLIAKLTLFRKILDRRFRTFKRVEISREYGLRVRDICKDENGAEIPGDVIPLEKLSSGEQETLVLYYQLIFETAPGTMLLIDEPEISLHIAWQRHFIDELKEIVRLNDLRAVVATHSVSILNGNWDIEVNLGELYKNGRAK